MYMWTPEEDNSKQKLNELLTANNAPKKPVFDLIAQGGSVAEVNELVSTLILQAQANKLEDVILREYVPNVNIFGRRLISQNAIDDFSAIMRLVWMIGGALMPDGHRVGENKAPVGSVFVTENEVFPGIVGSDIACSVYMTLTNMAVTPEWFDENIATIEYVFRHYAMFGHESQETSIARTLPFYQNVPELETIVGRDVWYRIYGMAVNQFGSMGSGNHFLEAGLVDVVFDERGRIKPVVGNRKYLAFMTHFGSRNIGSVIAKAFELEARSKYNMPRGMTDAPLSLNTPEGRDYWKLMNWAGDFTEAGHRWAHETIINALADRLPLDISKTHFFGSRHNFAWYDENEGIIHRKGATPAANGQYGIIPATMGDVTAIVDGLGERYSFNSASHGGGRELSRTQALGQNFDTAAYVLKKSGVYLIGGGADEDPRAYKRIEQVMAEQTSCVRQIGGFTPKVVRMAAPEFMGKRGK